MSNKTSFRRAKFNKKRQEQFCLKQSITDMVIPKYNALRDPFLVGFFEQPSLKNNLRRTGVITRKRGLSLRNYNELIKDPSLAKEAEKIAKKRKSKSVDLKKKKEQNQSFLPNIDTLEERNGVMSQQSGRNKKIYKSQKKSVEL